MLSDRTKVDTTIRWPGRTWRTEETEEEPEIISFQPALKPFSLAETNLKSRTVNCFPPSSSVSSSLPPYFYPFSALPSLLSPLPHFPSPRPPSFPLLIDAPPLLSSFISPLSLFSLFPSSYPCPLLFSLTLPSIFSLPYLFPPLCPPRFPF